MQKIQSTYNRKVIYWVKDAWFLAAPYWTSPEKYKSAALLGVVIIFNLLTVYMTVVFNKWYNGFYDAIQHFNKPAFFAAIYKFLELAFFYILFQILAYYFLKILEVRWRRWSTRYYLDNWFNHQSYYKTRFLERIGDNPDQRISEDVNSFIILFLELTLGLLKAAVSLVSFIVILWTISGSFEFSFMNHHFNIHGYMVYAAIIYSIIGTYITFKIGKPLIKLDFQQQAYEADFRYGLLRVREYGENIAFYKGESQEKATLMLRFNNVVNNFVAIIYRQMKIDIFGVGYGQLAKIFPMVVASPRYFAKVIQLGDLIQISSAFDNVQGALSYFINAYSSLSGWRAIMDRLYGFQAMVNEANNLAGLPINIGADYLGLKNISVNLPDGAKLLYNINLCLKSGDRLLIRGASGSGKTTLLRVVAGLWPFAHGELYQKNGLTSVFIAQKPYLPEGSLKNAICYPKVAELPQDQILIELLERCGLAHLESQLDIISDWSSKFSLGEQQKIAFCRVLVNNPDIVYLDEATSALDEESEELMYNMLVEKLPHSVIVSVGHRSTIRRWHTQELNFNTLLNSIKT